MVTRLWVAALATAGALAATGCATTMPLREQSCIEPDARLAAVLATVPPEACARGSARGDGPGACESARLEVSRILSVCPAHEPSQLVAAVLAHESREPERAQQWLDDLLRTPQAQPEAAILRARIAVEDGNLHLARRLLTEQLRLRPDHAGLHETMAGILFLAGERAEADRHLVSARTLGAPAWRVAYHQGLIAEADGRVAEAEAFFEAAVADNPNAADARGRLRALRAGRP